MKIIWLAVARGRYLNQECLLYNWGNQGMNNQENDQQLDHI